MWHQGDILEENVDVNWHSFSVFEKRHVTLKDLEKAEDVAYQDILKKIVLTWGAKGFIVTDSNLVITWKDRPQMSIISWFSIGLRQFDRPSRILDSFCNWIFNLRQKEEEEEEQQQQQQHHVTLWLWSWTSKWNLSNMHTAVVMSHVLGICTVFYCIYIYIFFTHQRMFLKFVTWHLMPKRAPACSRCFRTTPKHSWLTKNRTLWQFRSIRNRFLILKAH